MKFITAISLSLLAAFANAQDDGLSHPTPAPDVSASVSPSGSWSSGVIPTGANLPGSGVPRPSRMMKKRSASPSASVTPSTTIVVPAASSSLYKIQETPI